MVEAHLFGEDIRGVAERESTYNPERERERKNMSSRERETESHYQVAQAVWGRETGGLGGGRDREGGGGRGGEGE
jgi:hypothetical protein